MYQNKISTALKLIQKYGVWGVIYTAIYSVKRWLVSPIMTPYFKKVRKGKKFLFKNKKLEYFYHSYNMTWENSRAIEVPIAMCYVREFRGKRILEVGNVLRHYYRVRHGVVDKYEKTKGVVNLDIADLGKSYKGKYDLILSISTIEHIGKDEDSQDEEKAVISVLKLEKLLKRGGLLVVTLPYGHNPRLDRSRHKLFSHIMYFHKINRDWKQISEKEMLKSYKNLRYGIPHEYIYVGEYLNR